MKAILFALLCVNSCIVFAQDKEKEPLEIKTGLFSSSIPYYHISGTDTTIGDAVAIGPLAGIYKNGFLVQYNFALIANELNKGAFMHTFTASYENYGNKPFDFYAALNHFIINNRASVPYTPLNNNINTYLAYNKTWLKPLGSLSYDFGKDKSGNKQSQINLATGVAHSFEWEKGENNRVEVDHSLTLSMGTNEFTSLTQSGRSVVKSAGSGSSRGRGRRNGGSSTTASTSPAFMLNSLEFGTYSRIELDKFSIIPQFNIYFPVNKNIINSVGMAWQLEMDYHWEYRPGSKN
jgi:hypothetical protein